MSELDRKLVRGSAWLALSFGGSQIVSLVVAAIVARFVAPSAFGLVGLASIAIVALTTLQESGLSLAVIHRRTDVERAAGTAFVFHVAASVVLYAAAFAIAPLLAHVFSTPRLTDVLRVLALVVIVRGLGDSAWSHDRAGSRLREAGERRARRSDRAGDRRDSARDLRIRRLEPGRRADSGSGGSDDHILGRDDPCGRRLVSSASGFCASSAGTDGT